jgi:starvation-inducible outer membrane lipoprotein
MLAMVNRGGFIGLILTIIALLLSGCVTLPDPETSQESNREVITAEYHGGIIIGQTFTARHERLNGLTFFIHQVTTAEESQSWVFVRLFHSPSHRNLTQPNKGITWN